MPLGSLAAAARTSARSWSESYRHRCSTWFSGPISTCQNATSGEYFNRTGNASAKCSSYSGTAPGFNV